MMYICRKNILYSVAYTIKMSKMGDHRIEGYFDFVVPPLEGLWWQEEDGNRSGSPFRSLAFSKIQPKRTNSLHFG